MKEIIGIFIGRFEPFHIGHADVVRQILQHCDRVLILIGSSHGSLDPKNPFSFKKRQEMISNYCDATFPGRVAGIFPLKDHIKDTDWAIQVRQVVQAVSSNAEVVLYGYHKDSSSYYLDFFPDWTFKELDNFEGINATEIRDRMFETDGMDDNRVPKEVNAIIAEWVNTEEFAKLKKEYLFYKSYREKFKDMEHPPTFVTVDAVIFDDKQHVLLIKRKDFPGKGYYSLPGGFVGQDETLEQSVLRTIEAKCGLILGKDVIRRVKVIDNPRRSLRGRTITHVFVFQIGKQIPCRAEWFNVNQLFLYEEQIFEDHKRIIESFAS